VDRCAGGVPVKLNGPTLFQVAVPVLVNVKLFGLPSLMKLVESVTLSNNDVVLTGVANPVDETNVAVLLLVIVAVLLVSVTKVFAELASKSNIVPEIGTNGTVGGVKLPV
jgi:uncharacterized membrane protein